MSSIIMNVKTNPSEITDSQRRRTHRFLHQLRKMQELEKANAHLQKKANDFGPYKVRSGTPSETLALIGWLGVKLGTKPKAEPVKGR